MFKVTIIFLALLNGYDSNVVPFGVIQSEGYSFPNIESCTAAGDEIAARMKPDLDRGLKSSGSGVLYGATVECTTEAKSI